jgi:hypothetical protein
VNSDTIYNSIIRKIMRAHDFEGRLKAAINARITPRAVYNRIAPPDLTAAAPDENWSQPLSLLLRSACLMRESMTDAFFPHRLAGLKFLAQEFLAAVDVFDDRILKNPDPPVAKQELTEIEQIESGSGKPREKCQALWQMISGRAHSTNT